NNFQKLLPDLSAGRVKSVLIYGTDKGVLRHIYSSILNTMKLEALSRSYKEIMSEGVNVALNNISLFATREIVQITDTPNSIDSNLLEVILKGSHHFPIFMAEELPPSSSVRKSFEASEDLAIIACYSDDENSIKRIIAGRVSEEGKNIAPDAVSYILHHVAGDRYIIENELTKLLAYTHDKKVITFSDAEFVISKSIISSPDSLCISFAKREGGRFFSEVSKLLAENISVVWILRALVRYYINIYLVLSEVEIGGRLDDAISKLKPPIFFKYLPDFRAICLSSNKDKVLDILEALSEAEKQSKLSIVSDKSLCDNLFFGVYK
nr:hypothetical protein [Rickettsiaceae bacterium]